MQTVSNKVKISPRNSLSLCIKSFKWLFFCLQQKYKRYFRQAKAKKFLKTKNVKIACAQGVPSSDSHTDAKSKCEFFSFDYGIMCMMKKIGKLQSQDKLESFFFFFVKVP